MRITIFNPLSDSVDFMFIPSDNRVKLARACYGANEHVQRLQMTWNSDYDHYNMFEQFRMPTFTDMARADYQDWTQRKLGLIPN